ncbi:MAG: serine/threonine-protein kinase [Myxococcota bacterium]
MDRLGEEVAMARIQSALFGAAPQPTLERYALLEKLGAGGYGAVYSAWDPRLDRKVALKVLHGGGGKALEREARALAKLAHPNVVTVHDVGTTDDALFLAMEFIDGTALSALDVKVLGWRRVVATYRQAAAGLWAAHEVGIVHRDFKPANAVLGTDGRVRVLDFGLATDAAPQDERSGDEAGTRTAGTPRYMAPEQHRCAPVDARTDQFSFCAALWESLHGTPAFSAGTLEGLAAAKQTPPHRPAGAPIPLALHRTLCRGLAARPEERFASMRALDHALARLLRRRVQLFGGAAIGTVALVAGLTLAPDAKPCAGSDRPPARWTDDTRDTLQGAFEGTGLPHAATVARTTTRQLRAWTQAWGAARHEACERHAEGLQSAEALDLRSACLDQLERRFDALVDVLADADEAAVDKAIDAAAALPDPAECADVDRLRERHRVPDGEQAAVDDATDDLLRARAEIEAGHVLAAQSLAAPIDADCAARTLTHPPTCVEAAVLLGDTASYTGAHGEALTKLRAGAVAAQRAKLPEPFARAAASLTWELGEIEGDFDAALTWAALGRAALDAPGSPVALSLLNNEGAVLSTAGRWDEAIATHERRLDHLAPDSPLRMHSLANLANIDNRRGQVERAESRYAEALALGRAAFGATHPRVLMTQQNRAGLRVADGRIKEAILDLDEVLAAQSARLGDTHPQLAAALVNRSNAKLAIDDAAGALADAKRAATLVDAAYGPHSMQGLEAQIARVNALVALGRTPEAVELGRTEHAQIVETVGASHAGAAFSLRALGYALAAHGETEEAAQALARSRQRFEALGMHNEARATTPPKVRAQPDETSSRSD